MTSSKNREEEHERVTPRLANNICCCLKRFLTELEKQIVKDCFITSGNLFCCFTAGSATLLVAEFEVKGISPNKIQTLVFAQENTF